MTNIKFLFSDANLESLCNDLGCQFCRQNQSVPIGTPTAECYCAEGYELEANGKNCTGKNTDLYI